MAETPSDPEAPLPESELLADLTPALRRELAQRSYVRVGDDLVWIELDGGVRRERARKLYYVQTARGVFRVSRLTGEVVEV